MMTLEEAIKHCKDVALSCTNKECALEHFQLLKWLQEYSNMLEKQGEQKSIDEIAKEVSKDKTSAVAFLKGAGIMNENGELAEQYRQGKQKHAEWHREDEQNLNACLGYIRDEFLRRWLTDIIHVKYNKPADKVEPKFKVGDWIVYNRNDSSREILYVYDIRDGRYYFNDNIHFSWSVKECDEKCHLWTIQDAKDGDVLAFDDETIVIFKDLYNATTFHSYCHIEDGIFDFSKDGMPDWWEGKGFHPATKEQREQLEKAMADAGYTFDFEKKELKKIENDDKPSENTAETVDMTEYNKGFECGKQRVLKYPEEYGLCKSSAWSKEDEYVFNKILNWCILVNPTSSIFEELPKDKFVERLKSLKDKYTLKPSDDQ